MPGILVIGSINADLVVRAPRFPAPGETIQGEELHTFPGGKGANQAVAAARLGATVSMLGRVGRDEFGDFLINSLKENKVNIQLIQRGHASTGAAIIVVDSNGQNSIVLSPGANANVTPADVENASFRTFGLLLLQLEIPLETVLSAARRARENGVRTILNPAPARPLTDELIGLADYIIPNETELSQLTAMPVIDMASAEKAARALMQRGAKNVIVTLGENGALLLTGANTEHIPAFKVKAVDTTAAGDAFIGGFAVKLLARRRDSLIPTNAQESASYAKHIEEAVRYGCACGALAVTKAGAQPSLPAKEEVEKLFRRAG
jgi:ribokinase